MTKVIAVKISEQELALLDLYCANMRVTRSEAIRRLIRQLLQTQHKTMEVINLE
ncbi:hypothetical protein SPV3_ORF45 [Sulfolobus polyhedral virus 3]|nr:hypothetical protein SPV3_ORF45 [Sulfolobus polyhedral virus 3]